MPKAGEKWIKKFQALMECARSVREWSREARLVGINGPDNWLFYTIDAGQPRSMTIKHEDAVKIIEHFNLPIMIEPQELADKLVFGELSHLEGFPPPQIERSSPWLEGIAEHGW